MEIERETGSSGGGDGDFLREQLRGCEAALARARKAERLLEQINAHVTDFAIVLLTPDGRVAGWNEGAERLLGYREEDILGTSARVLFTPEDRDRGVPEEELRQAAAEGRADDDRWLQRKDGGRFWASGVSSRILSERRELEGFVKIIRDRTPQKLHADELRRINESLELRIRERTGELEDAFNELGAFSYSIAHDLRAPLRAMTAFAQLLAEDYREALGETGRLYTRRIAEAATHMSQMIQDLLAYSRVTRAEILCHAVDAERMLDDVLLGLEAEIREAKAEVVVERPLPRALGHEVTLHQVFSNLLSNAIKFARPGVPPRIRVRGEVTESWIRYWVEDNGIGIPIEYQSKIFGIFERLHPANEYPGTGIGLAIVHRAMERMRGRVGVESVPGRGSRFWIELRKLDAPPRDPVSP